MSVELEAHTLIEGVSSTIGARARGHDAIIFNEHLIQRNSSEWLIIALQTLMAQGNIQFHDGLCLETNIAQKLKNVNKLSSPSGEWLSD